VSNIRALYILTCKREALSDKQENTNNAEMRKDRKMKISGIKKKNTKNKYTKFEVKRSRGTDKN